MPVLLDTTAMDPTRRCRAMATFLESLAVPMSFSLDEPVERARTYVAAWQLGRIRVHETAGSAFRCARGPREIHATSTTLVSVMYCVGGSYVRTIGDRGEQSSGAAGHLSVVDLMRPYATSWSNGSRAFAIQLGRDDLGLPDHVLHHAIARLQSSPLREPVRDHIERICTDLPRLDGREAGRAAGKETTNLVRLLLASTDPGTIGADAREESLPLRIETYIIAHLGDAGLNAQRIAGAHFISRRKLYQLWSGRPESLREWIFAQRLERAHADIVSDSSRSASIETIARRWGFVDMTHFSRRFRERFGMSAREQRASWGAERTPPPGVTRGDRRPGEQAR